MALPTDKAGELIQAIYAYRGDKETRPTDPVVNAIFDMIRARLDADAEKYQERCAKNKANVLKRSYTNANERKRNAPDNDNDNDNDKDIIKRKWKPANERKYDFDKLEKQMLGRT